MKNKSKVKYVPKTFLLTVFNEFGLRTTTKRYNSFTDAKNMGDNLDIEYSFVISEVVFNSLKKKITKP